MKEQLIKNRKQFYDATKVANKAWISSINHFAKEDYKIDIYSLIASLWSEKEELFKRYTNVSHKRIEKFLMSSDNMHTVESELQAYEVGSFLISQIEKEIKDQSENTIKA